MKIDFRSRPDTVVKWNNEACSTHQLSYNHPDDCRPQWVFDAWNLMENIANECLLNKSTLVASNACNCEHKESERNFPVFAQTLFLSCEDCNPKRSEEHTSELQSPYVISYAVFCL